MKVSLKFPPEVWFFAKSRWYKEDAAIYPFPNGGHSGSALKTGRTIEQTGMLHLVRRRELLAFEDTRPDSECGDLQLRGV
jgi:hypothetical protein